MMRSGRPVSSPGRVENYPPPLMRFIRSKSSGGSRGRGRYRASPMFLKQKKTSAGATAETQEPSSPKVTCMGQVRVRRSKQSGSAGNPSSRCEWLRNALLCCRFAGKHGAASSSGLRWPDCLPFSSCKRRGKSKGESDFTRSEPDCGIASESAREIEGGNEWGSPNSFLQLTSSPPRNALSLTRSRSAPYRSSSLACRFWESQSQSQSPPPEEEAKQRIADEPKRESIEESPKPKTESISSESDRESESSIIESGTDARFEFTCEIECSMKEIDSKSEKIEEGGREESELGFMRPPILIRCKSLPASTRELLDPEIGLWRKKIWFYD